LFVSGDAEAGRSMLLKALGKKEADVAFRATAAQLFLQAGMHKDALPLLEAVVAQYPSDVRSLANLGYACMQLEQYERARQVLTSALELDPKNSVVRLNRAITFLRAKQYDAAKEDYLALEAQFPNAYQVQFGLGEVAAASNDTNGAIGRFESCLKLTPVGTPDYIQVSNRLAAVRNKAD
jgi:tetratricopeptide (TPR) repeat protein